MSEESQTTDGVAAEIPAVSSFKKFGQGIFGFLACAAVMIFVGGVIDAVFSAAGSEHGAYGGSMIIAIGIAYFIFWDFPKPYFRTGGRIAIAVWIGSIVVGFILALVLY